MRIAIVGDRIVGRLTGALRAAELGGAEKQLAFVSRGLAARGHHVTVLSTDVREDAAVDGVTIAGYGRSADRIAHVPAQWLALAAKLRRKRPDVVLTRGANWRVGLVASAARAVGSRFLYSVAHIHDVDGVFADVFGPARGRLYRLGLGLAAGFACQTGDQRQAVGHWTRKPACVVGNYVDIPDATVSSPSPIVTWVGNFVPHKRIEILLPLADRLRDLPMTLQIVGRSADHPQEADILRQMRLRPNVTFRGPLPPSEALKIIGDSLALVQTSEAEGLSNVLLEAWAAGVPTVVLDHDPDNLIRDLRVGFACDGSIERMAEAVRALASDHGLRHTMSLRARELAIGRFSPVSVLDRWEGFLFDLTQSPSLRGSHSDRTAP
jgi:glycosyltransferase involved in cell wall biosynthesis